MSRDDKSRNNDTTTFKDNAKELLAGFDINGWLARQEKVQF